MREEGNSSDGVMRTICQQFFQPQKQGHMVQQDARQMV